MRTKGDYLKPAAALGYAYARSGPRGEAEGFSMRHSIEVAHPSNAAIALIYIGMDEKERALEFLEKSYQARESTMTHLKVEPLFDSLRSELPLSRTATPDVFGLDYRPSSDRLPESVRLS